MVASAGALAALLTASLVAWPHPAAAAEAIPGAKSGSTAFFYSFLGTAVPIGVGASSSSGGGAVLAFGGYLMGPSLGHFYSGRPGRAFLGVGIRSAAFVGAAAAIGASWDNDNSTANVLGAACLILGVSSALVDVLDAPHSASVHNQALRAKVGVAPAMVGPEGAPGFRVDCGF